MQKGKFTSFLLFITLLNLGLMGCTKTESSEPIGNVAAGLDIIRKIWVKQGHPNNFDPTNLVRSSVEHFYTFTNEISVGGKDYHCRFAGRSELIHTPGAMAITDDGIVLWVYDKDGKAIVSPEKNGIERVDK